MEHRDRIEREDLSMFLRLGLAATGQREFYQTAAEQKNAERFLHHYISANYRRAYAHCLAAGLSHHTQTSIIARLLALGAPADPAHRAEEGALLAQTLRRLPPQRVYRLWAQVQKAGINNRRSRALAKFWLNTRPLALDAVKYRRHLKNVLRHYHVPVPGELGQFIQRGPTSAPNWSTPLLEQVRQAHYSAQALRGLPFTVAEGLLASRGYDREKWLPRLAENMTAHERTRLDRTLNGAADPLNLGHLSLRRLATYYLADPAQTDPRWDTAFLQSARRAKTHCAARLGRVVAILDRSYSTWGSRERLRHPLALALGVEKMLAQVCDKFTAIWTPAATAPLVPGGNTALARPLLDALDLEPDWVILVSDGFENDPPGGAAQVAEAYKKWGGRAKIVQLAPVVDANEYQPRAVVPAMVALREAEDAPALILLAEFLAGLEHFSVLQARLAAWAQSYLRGGEVL